MKALTEVVMAKEPHIKKEPSSSKDATGGVGDEPSPSKDATGVGVEPNSSKEVIEGVTKEPKTEQECEASFTLQQLARSVKDKSKQDLQAEAEIGKEIELPSINAEQAMEQIKSKKAREARDQDKVRNREKRQEINRELSLIHI